MAENFRSFLAPQFEAFLQEKRSCGCRYVSEAALLRRLDRTLCDAPGPTPSLSREQVEQWTIRRPHERPRTHQARILLVRQFALFLRGRGIAAFVPDARSREIVRLDFVPHIFTREQIRQLLKAADRWPFDPRAPERQRVLSEVLRVLYGCGLRLGEVLRLRVAEVDLTNGVLRILQSKFRKDRLVPLAPTLTERLRRYAAVMKFVHPDAVFFPNPWGCSYSLKTVYQWFRVLLRQCGIAHGGRGRGPRLHDLRHTFAVHCLERWYRQGEDLNARLPLLVAYLGHESLLGTQRYLRLTPVVFPDVVARLESFLNQSTRS